MRILVTGGAGYIGTHACVELLNAAHKVVVIDNLSNSSFIALERVAIITDKKLIVDGENKSTTVARNADIIFYNADICDREVLQRIFKNLSIDAVFHFAGFKAVLESSLKPLMYYENNVSSCLNLLSEMANANVKKIIFSSTASVYGYSEVMPVTEDCLPNIDINPYGRSKLIIETVLRDLHRADPSWKIAVLRYFNPVGAHASGMIGEDPRGEPSNIMPRINQVAIGKMKKLFVFGDAYHTRDGTGVRDYIHVVDLVKGHLAALEYLNNKSSVFRVLNLGTGRGYSVFELISAFEKVSNQIIPYEVVAPRIGDVAESWASTKLVEQEMNWVAEYDLLQMCEDTWRWQQKNPEGYN